MAQTTSKFWGRGLTAFRVFFSKKVADLGPTRDHGGQPYTESNYCRGLSDHRIHTLLLTSLPPWLVQQNSRVDRAAQVFTDFDHPDQVYCSQKNKRRSQLQYSTLQYAEQQHSWRITGLLGEPDCNMCGWESGFLQRSASILWDTTTLCELCSFNPTPDPMKEKSKRTNVCIHQFSEWTTKFFH